MNIFHQRIKTLIEDTSELFYNSTDAMNADFAEFASLAISEFSAVLKEPGLTRTQLTAMLRAGMTRSRVETHDNWPHFMASHMADATNVNMAD